MFFSTIIDQQSNIYHGFILSENENSFVFAFRINKKNYIWTCEKNYWILIK